MGKIHTHYDNLKVARGAPQEVIRAAYKALSQKYHPDKNPGDDKAARIMAIVNSAYGTLADPQRRKEHDAWIAQEEWEIEWLESTREERSPAEHSQAWPERLKPRRRVLALLRSWRWWTTVGVSVAVGWVAGALSVGAQRPMPALLAGALGGGAAASANAAGAGGLTASVAARPHAAGERGEARQDLSEAWAGAKPAALEAATARSAPIKVVAVSQVVLPGGGGGECEGEGATLSAPNGEPWPAHSGYVDGFPVGNKGEEMQLMLDNSANPSAAFIKVYDMERRSNVRYAYVQAHDKLLVDKLSNGKYEIRYQNVELGAGKGGCASRPAGAALQ